MLAPQPLEAFLALPLLGQPRFGALALLVQLLALHRQPHPGVEEPLAGLAVASRQETQLADGRQRALAVVDRQQQPQVAPAAEPVERHQAAVQVVAHLVQPALELGDPLLQLGDVIERQLARRLRLGHPLFLQLELQPGALDVVGQPLLAQLHLRQPCLQASDLATDPFEVTLAILLPRQRHRQRGEGEQQRQQDAQRSGHPATIACAGGCPGGVATALAQRPLRSPTGSAHFPDFGYRLWPSSPSGTGTP